MLLRGYLNLQQQDLCVSVCVYAVSLKQQQQEHDFDIFPPHKQKLSESRGNLFHKLI